MVKELKFNGGKKMEQPLLTQLKPLIIASLSVISFLFIIFLTIMFFPFENFI